MSARKRKCYVCGADLTSKQIETIMFKNQLRICCPGKCSEKIKKVIRLFDKEITND